MTDSYQKIIDDIKIRMYELEGMKECLREQVGLSNIIDRLEALRAQPYAHAAEADTGIIYFCTNEQCKRIDNLREHYTIPLIRAD